VILATGCSTDPTTSDEYLALEQELAAAHQQLVDALTQAAVPGGRYNNAARIQSELIAILDDPEAFGTEDEIADLLATHATPEARMDDDVFGSQSFRAGFYNTLYGMVDAQIDVYDTWLCDDGSQGGALWQWHGTNTTGNPFELAGISLATYDEDGRVSYELVTYPYPDAYVREAFMGSGN
jgi:hypothetical protein